MTTDQPTLSPLEEHSLNHRKNHGKSLRHHVPRQVHGEWKPAKDRSDIIEAIRKSDVGRVENLIPVKMQRMSVSPFAFLRGTAFIMASDLAGYPVSGINVQLCGDAHVANLGAYATPESHMIFDLNDFDETMIGPWECDIKRLVTSVYLAGEEAGNKPKTCTAAIRLLVNTYRHSLQTFAKMTVLELAHHQVRRHGESNLISDLLDKANTLTPLVTLKKLTKPDDQGLPKFNHQPVVLEQVSPEISKAVIDSLNAYREELTAGRRLMFDRFHASDVAFKVVGTGSVGTRDYVVLMFANGLEDPLFMQVKEEVPSCMAPYLPDKTSPKHQGQRVAQGQQRIQPFADPFLGWTTIDDRPYLVRQLANHKAGVDLTQLVGESLDEYAAVAGEVLAKAHAHTGDAAALAGYCGTKEPLDDAMVDFAVAYSEQVKEDYEVFMNAIKDGKLPIAESPEKGKDKSHHKKESKEEVEKVTTKTSTKKAHKHEAESSKKDVEHGKDKSVKHRKASEPTGEAAKVLK